MEWTTSLKCAIDYMETHLLEDISAGDVADAVHVSPFYFQKGFRIMTGYTVSEYIRYRRLYLAALDVLADNERIIDLSCKYGYETPESFTKAFCRFHGISPLKLRNNTARLQTFLPLKVTVEIKGGYDMDYSIEKMDAITMLGFERTFDYDSANREIPKFWDDFYQKNCHDTSNPELTKQVVAAASASKVGEYGICIDDSPEKNTFRYMIAGIYDGGIVPEGMTLYEIPALTWAKFRCVGSMPAALQAMNTRIYKEWLPGSVEYEIAEDINVEWYSQGDNMKADYESAVWIPVKTK